MSGQQVDVSAAKAAVASARRAVAIAQAQLASAAVAYADARVTCPGPLEGTCPERVEGPGRARPGEFVADELSLVLREQPYYVARLLARSRRLATDLPTVWAAFCAGDLDAEQTRVIDRMARRVTEASTLAAVDASAVAAAQTCCPKQLSAWLLRLVVRLEPEAFAARHRRALADRRVTIVQGVDGMGYVTGEVSAQDAAAIDGMLAAAARSLGTEDPRTEQQRRSDLFTDLLLGRLGWADDDAEESSSAAAPEPAAEAPADLTDDQSDGDDQAAGPGEWLEVEQVDPDTGELLGTTWQRLDPDGEPVGSPRGTSSHHPFGLPVFRRGPRRLRIGVVVPLSSLLGLTQAPGELADRSGMIPGEVLRQLIADTLHPDGTGHSPDSRDEVLFTRLLTDDGGRLLDTTELGRYPSRRLAEAVMLRAGTCRFPTCSVPADRCDLDHHQPVPRGPTSGQNLDPPCRRHHRAKTHAWHATLRDHDGVDWTMPDGDRYRCPDEPLPTGRSG